MKLLVKNQSENIFGQNKTLIFESIFFRGTVDSDLIKSKGHKKDSGEYFSAYLIFGVSITILLLDLKLRQLCNIQRKYYETQYV